jgi:hypothetical protein
MAKSKANCTVWQKVKQIQIESKHTKCTCPVLNALRADTPFCIEYLPEGGYARQKWCICPEGFQTGLVHV